MTISYTLSLRLWQATAGDPSVKSAWAPPVDSNMALIDSAVNGTSIINLGGLTAYTLAVANGAPDEAREQVYNFQGALPGNCTVTLPNVPKVGWAINNTTGGFSVTMTAGAGSTAVIPPDGLWHLFSADGAGNVIAPTLVASASSLTGTTLSVSGNGTIGGVLTAGSIFSNGNIQTTSNGYIANVYAQSISTNTLALGGAFSANQITASGIEVTGQNGSAIQFGHPGAGGSIGVSTSDPPSFTLSNISGSPIGVIGGTSSNIYNGFSASGTLFLAPIPGSGYNGWSSFGLLNIFPQAGQSNNCTVRINPSASGAVNVNSSSSPSQNFTCFVGNILPGSFYCSWEFGGTVVGSIGPTPGGNGVAYNTTSDQRLKIDRGRLSGEVVTMMLLNLKPRWFNWKADPDGDPEIGFFAQQIERWVPWAVTRGRGRTGKKNFRPWQTDNAKLVPLLTAALQDALKRIDALEKAR